MIKISAETHDTLLWLNSKFGERPFTFSEVSDRISPVVFEKFKVDKFIISDDTFELENPGATEVPEGWRINWSVAGDVIKRRKYLCH